MLGQFLAGQARLDAENIYFLLSFHFVICNRRLGFFLFALVHTLAADHAHAAAIDHHIASLIGFLRDRCRGNGTCGGHVNLGCALTLLLGCCLLGHGPWGVLANRRRRYAVGVLLGWRRRWKRGLGDNLGTFHNRDF